MMDDETVRKLVDPYDQDDPYRNLRDKPDRLPLLGVLFVGFIGFLLGFLLGGLMP